MLTVWMLVLSFGLIWLSKLIVVGALDPGNDKIFTPMIAAAVLMDFVALALVYIV